MSIELSKSDLTQVSPISGRDTLRVLPIGKHKTQRIVVGDSDGQLLCFAWKKGAAKNEFKLTNDDWKTASTKTTSSTHNSSPVKGTNNHSILALTLAGDKGDKCFISQKSGLKGINKKGNIFYDFTTNLADPITKFQVAGTHLHTAALYSYTLYDNSQEEHHVMTPGEIHSLVLGPKLTTNGFHTAIIGCEDRMIRICEGGKYLLEVPVDASTKSLCISGNQIFYGLGNGTVGCYESNWSSNSNRKASKEGKEGKESKAAQEGKEGKSSSSNSNSNSNSNSTTDTDSEENPNDVTLRRLWKLKHTARAAVNCLCTWDPYKDGTEHLVVGRDDGTIELVNSGNNNNNNNGNNNNSGGTSAFDNGTNGSGPTTKFQTNLNESIRAIDIGTIVSPSYDELVVATFTGRVCSFTTESLSKVDPSDKYGRSKLQLRNEGLIVETKKEIDSLKKQVAKEVKKYNKNGNNKNGDMTRQTTGGTVVNFHVNLDASNAKYTCKVELPTPIDYVVLVGDVMGAEVSGTDNAVGDVSIHHTVPEQDSHFNHGNDTDSNTSASTAATSTTATTTATTRHSLLATIRPAANENETSSASNTGGNKATAAKVLEWCIRPVEGQYGDVKILVVSSKASGITTDENSKKNKNNSNNNDGLKKEARIRTAIELKMNVKPLSLHQIEHTSSTVDTSTISTLTITGQFSAERAHSWVYRCVPGVSPQMSDCTVETSLSFRNTLLGTHLIVEYERGRIKFSSDNVSTLTILNDVVSNDAMETSMKIQMNSDISDNSVRHMMSLLQPMIEEQFNLSRDVHVVQALKEAVGENTEDGSLSYLDPRLIHLLKHCNELKKELEKSPGRLRMLFGIVTDLFIDMHMFKGRKLNHLGGKLGSLLQDYNHAKIVEWMYNPQ